LCKPLLSQKNTETYERKKSLHNHHPFVFVFKGWRKEIRVKLSATETMKGNIDVALTGTNGIRRKYTIDK